MNYSTGSTISFTDEKGNTYTGVVLQVIDALQSFGSGFSTSPRKGFILAVGEVGSTYDVIGYDSQITEVLCETGK